MTPNTPNPEESNDRPDPANDRRCRKCGHHRFECKVCRPGMTNVHAGDKKKKRDVDDQRRKIKYCCKCYGAKKFMMYFVPEHKDGDALSKEDETKSEAAAQLRSCLLSTLKAGQQVNPPKLCDMISPFGLRHDDDNNFEAGGPVLIILSCRVPQPSINSTVTALELHVRQVFSIVQRLISLLSNGDPIDASLLRTVLRTLFSQLANLTHRTFRQLATGDLPASNTHQHMLQVARNQAQRSYRSLWAHALRAGFLGSSRVQLGGLGALLLQGAEIRRSLVRRDQQAAVRQLLLSARDLAARLRFWRAMLMAGRSM
ncbi:hypothetical protein E2P81_ATG10392 [Venturia nashicola]|nr:hypothetical protein E2P81_ATG10392 [Venturia nashicola]